MICSVCGARLDEDSLFCAACGNPVHSTGSDPEKEDISGNRFAQREGNLPVERKTDVKDSGEGEKGVPSSVMKMEAPASIKKVENSGGDDTEKHEPEKRDANKNDADQNDIEKKKQKPGFKDLPTGKKIGLAVGTIFIILGLIRVLTAGTSISATSFGGDFYTYTYQGIVAVAENLAVIEVTLGWILAAIGAAIDMMALQ